MHDAIAAVHLALTDSEAAFVVIVDVQTLAVLLR